MHSIQPGKTLHRSFFHREFVMVSVVAISILMNPQESVMESTIKAVAVLALTVSLCIFLRVVMQEGRYKDVVFRSNKDNYALRIIKNSCLPIQIYNIAHAKMGKIACLSALNRFSDALKLRELPGGYQRIKIEVEGSYIEGAIAINEESKDRFLLFNNDSHQLYEEAVRGYLPKICRIIKSSMICFNYPGVGFSEGPVGQVMMKKAYLAFLEFIETFQPKAIICLGHSFGGAVQGDALDDYEFKPTIKYLSIKSRTFKKSKKKLTLLFGWGYDTVEAGKRLPVKEIVLQTAKVERYEILTDSSKIIDDGVIPACNAYGEAIFTLPAACREFKTVIGIPEAHDEGFRVDEFAKLIEDNL